MARSQRAGSKISKMLRSSVRHFSNLIRLPAPFVRGSGTYTAALNPTNPVGTIESIEYALRSWERMAEREREKLDRLESDLATYRREVVKPFEHEARLRELELNQAELNEALDVHKSDPQAIAISESARPGNNEGESLQALCAL